MAVLSVPSSRGAWQEDLGISCSPWEAARLGGAEYQPLGGAGEGLQGVGGQTTQQFWPGQGVRGLVRGVTLAARGY